MPRLRSVLDCLVITMMTLAGPAAAQEGPSTEELDAKVDALASELNRLRESLSVPEEEARKSRFGLGPAASKVYDNDGLSIGGYGELFFGHYFGDDATRPAHRGDVYRFIAYFGYKFDDLVVFNTEVEFEHIDQAVVEFMYVDLLLSEHVNLRTGLMLMPMGIVNEMHEPTTFRGNFRPETERTVIPSTWREVGVGLLGSAGGFDYKLYLVSGLRADGFDLGGVAGGKQRGKLFVWEDKAAVARLGWSDGEMLDVGASAYYGGADQDPTEATEVTHLVYEAHFILRVMGAEIRGLFAEGRTDGDVGGSGLPDDPATAVDESAGPFPVTPTVQRGWYVEGSYDLGPVLGFERAGLSPFFRFERLDLNVEVPAGYVIDAARNTTRLIAGLEYKPHPDVVFKGEYDHGQSDVEGADPVQELRLGVGFIF